MSVAEQIVDAVVLELGRHRSEINADRDLVSVRVMVRLDRQRDISEVSISRESERRRGS